MAPPEQSPALEKGPRSGGMCQQESRSTREVWRVVWVPSITPSTDATAVLLLKGQEMGKVAFVAKKLIRDKVNPWSRREDVDSVMKLMSDI